MVVYIISGADLITCPSMRKVLVPSLIHKYPTDGLKILTIINKIINMLNEIRMIFLLPGTEREFLYKDYKCKRSKTCKDSFV